MHTFRTALWAFGKRSLIVAVAAATLGGSIAAWLPAEKASAYTSNYFIQKVQDGRIPSSQVTGFQQSQQVIKRGGVLYYSDLGNGTLAKTENGVSMVIAGRTSTTSTMHDVANGVLARDARVLAFGMEVGSDGTVYIADAYTHKIWRISEDGRLYTVAGNGQAGAIEDHAADITQTVFNAPNYIKYGPDGLMYVSDGNMVRRINADGSVTRIVGQPGSLPNVTEGGAALDQILPNPSLGNKPQSNVLDFDSQGRLHIGTGPAIYRVDADGTIHTVLRANLESGAGASFTREDQPVGEKVFPTPFTGFAIDHARNDDIWLTMSGYYGFSGYDQYATIFRVHDGVVSSVAGGSTSSNPNQGRPPAYGEMVYFEYVSAPFVAPEGVYFFWGAIGGATLLASPQTDRTPPTIEPVFSAQPVNGWYTSPVTVSWNVTDPESAILAKEGCDTTTVDYETHGRGFTCRATSIGGVSSKSLYVPVDMSAPTLGIPTWSQNPKPISGTSTLTIHADDNISGVQRAEYFVGDTDPGAGNGTAMDLVPAGAGADLSTSFDASFPAGVHKINMRAQNNAGLWSAVTSDYLTVFDTNGPQDVAASKQFVPQVGIDMLPGMPDNNAKAKLGFDVFYTSTGSVDPASELSLDYETGHGCNGANPTNCHTTNFQVTSIAPNSFTSLLIGGQNSSVGTINGQGTLTIDGSSTTNPFRAVATDGNRTTPATNDSVDLYIYPPGSNPTTATPLYHVHVNTSGNWVKIQ